MRSFKSKVLSACAWAVPILSAAVPLKTRHADAARPDGSILELDVQHHYAQATFSVPCAGCLGQDHTSHDDESIILRFATYANDQPCGVSNVTLNGVYLPQEWKGDIASGFGSYTGVTDIQENAWFLQHNLDLEWQAACIQGENETDDAAQVLTLNIKAIDGKLLDQSTGFTVSFKQNHSPPELLRLSSVPVPSASEVQYAKSWLEPPAHLRLVPPSNHQEIGGLDFPVPASLEDEIRELRALQAELKELQKAIHQKQEHIESQTKQAAENFKERLQQCGNITCVFKTITSGAHKVWKLLYVQFRPNNHTYSPSTMGRPQDDNPHGWMANSYKQVPKGNMKMEAVVQVSPLTPTATSTPPPLDKTPPESSHQGSPRMPRPDSPFIIAIEVVVGLLCCGCLIAVVRNRCSSLRTRTDRAAIREERRNARAYRRAARKHAWRNWWRGNWRDRARIEDYEEKRALIQEQEDVLEEAMQEEIRQLRAVHGIVNDLIGAEEGRLHRHTPQTHCHCTHMPQPQPPYSPLSTTSTYPPTSLPEIPSRPLSRTDSLPGYASSLPPAYETDEDTSDSVPNGFRNYAPSTSSSSGSSSRWTPDSSVVDVSPRPSAETLRYPDGAHAEADDETTRAEEKN